MRPLRWLSAQAEREAQPRQAGGAARTIWWRITQAGSGAILIALLMLAAGLMKTINLLVLLGDLLLVLVAFNGIIAWRATRRLRILREGEPDCFAGKPASKALTIANDQAKATTISLRETSADHDWAGFAAAIPAGSSQRLRMSFTSAKRGIHPISTTLSSGYPFGFISVERVIDDGAVLTVFPALGRIDLARFRRWLIRAGAADSRSRRAVSRPSLQRADLRGVRPFRTGDSPRLIHWRTTARRNELMAREYDSTDALDLILILEAWLPLKPSKFDRERLEAAISLAATLLDSWCNAEQSPRVTLIVTGRIDAMEGRASPALARKFFRALAATAGSEEEIRVPKSNSPRAVRLIVSSQPNPAIVSSAGWQRLSPNDAPAWYHAPTPPE